jgi:uncharacterized membrane protein YadS
MVKKTKEQKIVMPKYILYFEKSFIFNDAHAITIDTLEDIKTTVLTVAIGTLSSPAHRSKSPGSAAIRRNI